MLAPRQIIFTAVDDVFFQVSGEAWETASEALQKLARQGIPLVLSSRGTRAQLEPVRRKIQHGHPFLTESGAGLFIPDGYFNLRLEGATRFGRNFCVPFGRTHIEAAAALPEIAEEAGASVVGFSQMSLREIARSCGLSSARCRAIPAARIWRDILFRRRNREDHEAILTSGARKGLGGLARHSFLGTSRSVETGRPERGALLDGYLPEVTA